MVSSILVLGQSGVDTETMTLPNDVEALTLLESDPIREDAATLEPAFRRCDA